MPPLTGLDLAELALLVTALGAAIVAWRNQKAGEATTLLAEYGKRLAMLDTKVCELEKKVMRLQDDNEKLRERIVQLDSYDVLYPCRQKPCQRSRSRPDLDHRIIRR